MQSLLNRNKWVYADSGLLPFWGEWCPWNHNWLGSTLILTNRHTVIDFFGPPWLHKYCFGQLLNLTWTSRYRSRLPHSQQNHMCITHKVTLVLHDSNSESLSSRLVQCTKELGVMIWLTELHTWPMIELLSGPLIIQISCQCRVPGNWLVSCVSALETKFETEAINLYLHPSKQDRY